MNISNKFVKIFKKSKYKKFKEENKTNKRILNIKTHFLHIK